MQSPSQSDIQKRQHEQSKCTDIRAYAAEMLRRYEATKRSKKASQSPTGKNPVRGQACFGMSEKSKTSSRDIPVLQCGSNTTDLMGEASMIPDSIITGIQQLGSQSSHQDQIIPSQQGMMQTANPFMTSNLAKSAPTQMNNSTNDMSPTTNLTSSPGNPEGLPSPLQLGALRPFQATGTEHFPLPSNAMTSHLPGKAVEQAVPSPDTGSLLSQISSNTKKNYLVSCLDAMYGPDCAQLTRDLAELHIEATQKEQNRRKKKSGDAHGNSKGNKKSTHNNKAGVSKKAKQSKKVGSPKKKEFVCPYDGCEKAFERRYNLKVHTRRHTGEMPYTCPKTDEGCFLYFRWRSSLRHHLKTVHNDVVPIAQIKTRRTSLSEIPVCQVACDLSTTSCTLSDSSSSASSSTSLGSSKLRVSKKISIKKLSSKKKGKIRKNFPAVAVRQPTAQEVAYAELTAMLKTAALDNDNVRGEATAQHATQTTGNHTSLIVRGEENNEVLTTIPQSSSTSTSPACDFGDDSLRILDDAETDNAPSTDADESDLFDGMDIDVPSDFELPNLEGDLEGSEELEMKD